MKLRGLLTLLVGALLLGVGCTTDADINTSGAGSEGKIKTVKITATLPELGGTTRAEDSAKGGITNVDWTKYELRVIIKAYGAEGDTFAGQYATEVVDYKDYGDIEENGNISVDVGLPLTTGHKFDIYLWADYVLKSAPTADLHYNTAEFPAITLAGDSPTLVINDESYDAFFGKGTVNVGEIATTWNTEFSVQRAVAKLRMIATDAASATATNATLQTDKFYTGFNIATGETTPSLSTPMLSAPTAFETYDKETPAAGATEWSQSFITAYLLWPAVDEGGNATTSTIAANFYEGDNTEPVSTIAPTMEIPLKRGWLTTLRGEMFESGWDGTTLVEPMTIDGDWLVLNNAKELAWVLETGDTKEKNKIRITSDMDMGGNAVKPFPAWVSEFDGASHKISNFAIDGDALFTPNTDANYINEINIHDLNIEGATIENSGHVGVLVNRVGINATFENITIKNSSATTSDGAAGGVVGYIGGGTGLALEVKFINCDLENVKSSGTLDEGIFVGRMHGYNDDEILSFDADCSADANCAVTDFVSPYTEDNDAQWLDEGDSAFDFTKYNGWLGDEEINRGVINFEGHRMQIKWDGKKTITPMTDGSGAYLIYSPFDLAGVRKKTASPSAIYLKSDIDMNGQGTDGKYNVPSNFTKSAYSSADDNHFDPFNYVTTLDGAKDANSNYSIWNLSISQIEQERAAFILYATGTTVHKNINFRNCCTVSVHKPVETDAKAYGAILVSNVEATYTMENVHAYDCKVFALQKVGTLGARIAGTSTLNNCTVNNCYVENYECKINERFESGSKSMAGFTVNNVYADFYPYGEVGGMFGFIQDNSTITNCWTKGTIIYAYGQDDKEATIDADWFVQFGIGALKYYLVPGRHVSTLIGNIRATGTINITNSGADSSSKCTNRHDTHQWRVKTGGSSWNPKYTYYKYDYIGQAYFVKFLDSEGTVKIDGASLTIGDCKTDTLYGTYK